MKKIVAIGVMIGLFAAMAIAQQQVKKQFTDVTNIEVEGLFCQVTIDAVSSENVDFAGQISSASQNDKIKIIYKQTGTDLRVRIEAPNNMSGSVNGSLVFKVPRSTNIWVNNVSGNVSTKGLAGNKIALKSVSGKVEALNTASNIRAESVSGGLLIEGVEGNASLSSVSGSVNVSQVAGSLNVSTVSGSLDIKKVQGQTKASTVSGSLSASYINNGLSVSTTSGSINIDNVNGDVDSQSTSGSIRMNSVKGVIKAKTVSGGINGEGVMLAGQSSFSTMSGSVRMQLSNTPESLSFDLKSFSGKLNAKGIIGKERLIIEKGNIMVKGETFSGSQSYL
jgi:DUF4097 and DUF4098 domain-containing protein YvlB